MMELAEKLEQTIRNVPDFPEPGVQFKDITPVLAEPDLLRRTVEALAEPFRKEGVTRVVGIEARGFLLGPMLARELDAGFIPVRKQGKLPRATLTQEYDLEYGTDAVEMHADALGEHSRVLIHDDLLATGGTAAATRVLLDKAGAEVVGAAFLIELMFLEGRKRLADGLPIHVLLSL